MDHDFLRKYSGVRLKGIRTRCRNLSTFMLSFLVHLRIDHCDIVPHAYWNCIYKNYKNLIFDKFSNIILQYVLKV